jgi:UDP-glucose 4-epimerase
MLAGVKRQLGDTLETFLQNVQMAVNVCRILQDNPVRRVVFFSSAAVYGEEINNTSITEHTPVQPTSLYGAAKYASECLFQKVTAPSDPGTLLILRPPVIYGPGDMGNAYGPSGFVEAAAKGQTITIWGDGTERREFIFVEDAAEIACRLTFGDYAGIVNLASGTSYTFLNVLSAVTQALGKETATMSRPRSKPKVDHGFDNSRVTTLLPDFEFTPLDEGIRRLVAARG